MKTITPRKSLKWSLYRLIGKLEGTQEFEEYVRRDLTKTLDDEGLGSAKELADAMGVSTAYLSDIKLGRRRVNLATARKMRDAL